MVGSQCSHGSKSVVVQQLCIGKPHHVSVVQKYRQGRKKIVGTVHDNCYTDLARFTRARSAGSTHPGRAACAYLSKPDPLPCCALFISINDLSTHIAYSKTDASLLDRLLLLVRRWLLMADRGDANVPRRPAVTARCRRA
jgi:hypothetical protein